MLADTIQIQQNKFTKVLQLNGDDIDSISNLLFEDKETPYIMGFVSPHLDFHVIASKIQSLLPPSTTLVLSTSAGELCSLNQQVGGTLYLDANSTWNDIVLESFSSDMIDQIQTITVPLAPKEIKDADDMIAYIEDKISKISLSISMDYHNTIGITLIDGLSSQESFFMEAVYNSGKFPVLLVGGSSGGKLDFHTTYIYDGSKVVQNSAVVTFIKLNTAVKYGIFKSQNFQPTSKSFILLESNIEQRYAHSVIDTKTLEISSFIDALSMHFDCQKEKLDEIFKNYTFAIKVGDEYFIRSIASFDFEKDVINFFCDIGFADELILMKKSDFVKQTNNDFDKFMQNKSGKIVGGLLNDCILRRLNNAGEINMLKTFNDIPLVGFSTFGELLGVNINQTLTSIIFFENSNEGFRDYYVDNFVANYSNFKSYFMLKKIKQLNIILKIKDQLLQKIILSIPLIKQMLIALKDSVDNSYDVENKVDNILKNMFNYMDEIHKNTNDTKFIFEHINYLQNDIKKIHDSTKVSNDITKQSRILALNASVESAKAGVYGSRFSVISKELERLSDSTKEKLDTTANAVNNMYNKIMETNKKVTSSYEQLNKINSNSFVITDNMKNISDIMHQTTVKLKDELVYTTKLLEDFEVISKLEAKMKNVDTLSPL